MTNETNLNNAVNKNELYSFSTPLESLYQRNSKCRHTVSELANACDSAFIDRNKIVICEIDYSDECEMEFVRVRLTRDAQFFFDQLYKSVIKSSWVHTFIAWHTSIEAKQSMNAHNFEERLESHERHRELCDLFLRKEEKSKLEFSTSISTIAHSMVGFIVIDTSHVEYNQFCTILWISVVNKWQGMGIGRELVRFAELFAKIHKCTRTEVLVTFTTHMFRKMGYTLKKAYSKCNFVGNRKKVHKRSVNSKNNNYTDNSKQYAYEKWFSESNKENSESNENIEKEVSRETTLQQHVCEVINCNDIVSRVSQNYCAFISCDYDNISKLNLQRTLERCEETQKFSNITSLRAESCYGNWLKYDVAEIPELYHNKRISFRMINDNNEDDRRSWNSLLLNVTKYNMGGTRLLHETFAVPCRIVAVDTAIEQTLEQEKSTSELLFNNEQNFILDNLDNMPRATAHAKRKRECVNNEEMKQSTNNSMSLTLMPSLQCSHALHREHHFHHHHVDHIVALIAITAEGWIEFLACSPEYQHNGIGSFLLFLGLEWLRVRGVASASLSPLSRRAMSFYLKWGFTAHSSNARKSTRKYNSEIRGSTSFKESKKVCSANKMSMYEIETKLVNNSCDETKDSISNDFYLDNNHSSVPNKQKLKKQLSSHNFYREQFIQNRKYFQHLRWSSQQQQLPEQEKVLHKEHKRNVSHKRRYSDEPLPIMTRKIDNNVCLLPEGHKLKYYLSNYDNIGEVSSRTKWIYYFTSLPIDNSLNDTRSTACTCASINERKKELFNKATDTLDFNNTYTTCCKKIYKYNNNSGICEESRGDSESMICGLSSEATTEELFVNGDDNNDNISGNNNDVKISSSA